MLGLDFLWWRDQGLLITKKSNDYDKVRAANHLGSKQLPNLLTHKVKLSYFKPFCQREVFWSR